MYQRNVDRANPGCILFLIDQSGSMTESLASSGTPKAEAAAEILNRTLGEIISSCEKGEDKPRNYFDVGVLGYTTDELGGPVIRPLLGGALAGRDLVTVVELYENTRIERHQRAGIGVVNVPVWYEVPPADFMMGTPMCAILDYVWQVLSNWCAAHPMSFPPVVIHLTDGESTDGDPEPAAAGLRALATNDGNLLLFNCHLSGLASEPVLFPNSEGLLRDDYARLLFRMSSPLPERLLANAEVRGIAARPGARGMAFNADSVAMIHLINVGTMIAQNLR